MTAWKNIVKTVAPALGSALGGPVAGAAVSEIAGKWLGDESASEDQVEKAVRNASPDQLAKLRQIDKEFEAKMRKLDIDVYALEVRDRQDARKLALENMWPQICITATFVGGYFVIIYVLLSVAINMDPMTQGMLTTLMGVLTAGMQQILSFWFGSSKGSQDKDRTIQAAQGRR